MLLTLVGLAVFGGGALVNCAAKSVNNEMEGEINSVNESINSLCGETQREVNRAIALLDKNNSNMIALKQTIKNDEMEYFAQVFSGIRNFELKEVNLDFRKSFEKLELHAKDYMGKKTYRHNDDHLSVKDVAGEIALTYISPLIGIGKNIFKYCKLDDNLSVAKSNYEQAKIECEKAKQQCVIYKDSANKCNEISSILKALRHVFYMSIDKMWEICEKYEYDYASFPYEERKAVMSCVNLASGINDIICTNIINEDGTINNDAVKTIGKVKELRKSSNTENIKYVEKHSTKENDIDYVYDDENEIFSSNIIIGKYSISQKSYEMIIKHLKTGNKLTAIRELQKYGAEINEAQRIIESLNFT